MNTRSIREYLASIDRGTRGSVDDPKRAELLVRAEIADIDRMEATVKPGGLVRTALSFRRQAANEALRELGKAP